MFGMHLIVANALAKEFDLQVRQEPHDIDGLKRFSLVAPGGIVLRRPAEVLGWLRSGSPTSVGLMSDGCNTFDELYMHRHALVLALMRSMPKQSYYSDQQSDGSKNPGWFIVGIETKYDHDHPVLVTYHLPERLWDAAGQTGAALLNRMLTCDWHTSKDAIDRLYEFATRPAE